MRGFTLIEILVSLAIVSSIFFLGLPAYRDFNTRQQLLETSKLVKQDLLLTQQRASSGEKSVCQNPSTNSLLGYSVLFSSTLYEIYADCRDGTDPLIKKTDLPKSVAKTGGASSLTFKVLGQGTTANSDQTLTFTHLSTGKTATLTITRAGGIY